MSRQLKVYPGDIKDFLKGNGVIPIKEMAEYFDCTPTTIRKRIKDLRLEGEHIAPTLKGLMLIEDVTEKNADEIIESGNWVVGEFIGISLIGSVIKKPLLLVRKIRTLSKEDLRLLKRVSLLISQITDVVEVEKEFEPHQLEMPKN